jgi:cytochrome P450
MSHDSRTYKNPYEFDPTRFLGKNPEQDPRSFMFGAGRRICPGRFYVDNELFIMAVTSLATLNIFAAKDTDGKKMEPSIEYEGGFVV